jgi:hypothetical protein
MPVSPQRPLRIRRVTGRYGVKIKFKDRVVVRILRFVNEWNVCVVRQVLTSYPYEYTEWNECSNDQVKLNAVYKEESPWPHLTGWGGYNKDGFSQWRTYFELWRVSEDEYLFSWGRIYPWEYEPLERD